MATITTTRTTSIATTIVTIRMGMSWALSSSAMISPTVRQMGGRGRDRNTLVCKLAPDLKRLFCQSSFKNHTQLSIIIADRQTDAWTDRQLDKQAGRQADRDRQRRTTCSGTRAVFAREGTCAVRGQASYHSALAVHNGHSKPIAGVILQTSDLKRTKVQ